MNFRSDNVVPAAPEIMDEVVRANRGSVSSYGDDDRTRGLDRAFSELFEREVAIMPVVTGTAANALALATFTPGTGAIYCHEAAHIMLEEAGAPAFYAGAAALFPLPGAHGRYDGATLAAALAPAEAGGVHWSTPSVASVTQSTESGTLYTREGVRAIAGVAHEHDMAVHMDGARLANAVAALGCSPAEATWKLGVDVLSFGATKNGALGAEAVVLFAPSAERRARLAHLHKRGGHLLSKMRFVSAQLEAYLKDDLWLRLARHANTMAARMARGLAQMPGAELAHAVEANEVFVRLPEAAIRALLADGVGMHRWGAESATLVRLVCSYATTEAEVDGFLALARKTLAAA